MAEFTKTRTEYDTELAKDDTPTQVKVGGKTAKFVPNINASKWNNECWLNINHPDVVNTEKETFVDGKMELEIGNNIHRYYIDENGHLEYEIVLKEKPTSNKIELKLDFPDGLDFRLQKELTQKEIERGCECPENVVDSYAVYWKKKNNKYKTGKFCHIYRIKAIDKNGKWSWCSQRIYGKTWTITINQDFLNSALYPIIIDPVLGYDTAGSLKMGNATISYGGSWPVGAVGGSITKFHVAIGQVGVGNEAVKIVVSDCKQVDGDPSGEDVLEQIEIDPVTVSDDNEANAIGTNRVLGSTDYYLGILSKHATTQWKYDSGVGVPLWFDAAAGVNYATWFPTPMRNHGSSGNYAFSIWVDYEAAPAEAGKIFSEEGIHSRILR